MQSIESAPIPGFEGYYAATSAGDILSLRSGKTLKAYPNNTGYSAVTLYAPGRTRERKLVHQMVAAAFHGPSNGLVVRHRDGTKGNNAPGNLHYGTLSENTLDSVTHGTHQNARKTECIRGHKYTPSNTGLHEGGRRYCKACNGDRVKRIYRDKTRAAAIAEQARRVSL